MYLLLSNFIIKALCLKIVIINNCCCFVDNSTALNEPLVSARFLTQFHQPPTTVISGFKNQPLHLFKKNFQEFVDVCLLRGKLFSWIQVYLYQWNLDLEVNGWTNKEWSHCRKWQCFKVFCIFFVGKLPQTELKERWPSCRVTQPFCCHVFVLIYLDR